MAGAGPWRKGSCRAATLPHPPDPPGSTSMSPSNRPLLLSMAAAALALAGCQKQDSPAAAQPAFRLDEGQLLQPIRFSASDLDPAINACVDLAAHTNRKWLEANPIPADQTRWGAFSLLAE